MAQLLPSETHWRKIVPKNKLQNKIQITKSKPTWKQSCQCHLGTSVPVYLGTILPLCPSDIGTIFPK